MVDFIKSALVAILCFSLVVSSLGCATIFTGGRPNQRVHFSSTPQGATVLVNGKSIGITPLSSQLDRKANHQVRITLAGYPTYEREITSGFNGWVLGNVILGGLIGIIIDLISGSTDSLNPSSISVNLEKLKAEISPARPSGMSPSKALPKVVPAKK